MNLKHPRKALTQLETVLIIVAVILLGTTGYFVYQNSLPKPAATPPATTPATPPPVTTPPVTTPPPTPKTAEVKYSEFKVDPVIAEVGKPVVVSVTLTEIGGASVTQSVHLRVNGTVTETKPTTLTANGKSTVSFAISTPKVGKFSVDVEGMTGTYKIRFPIKNPGVMVAAFGDDTGNIMDPAFAFTTIDMIASMQVYDRLIEYDGASYTKFVPGLSTTVPTIENGLISKDGLTWTFPIRKGVKFHNGNDLTPSDVEYSIERALVVDPDGGPTYMLVQPLLGRESTREDGKIVVTAKEIEDSVEVSGDNVIIHLKEPCPWFHEILSIWVSSVLDKEWCIANGNWPDTWEGWEKYNNPEVSPLADKMMGSGAFKFDTWKHGVEFTFVRNDNWWKFKPSFEKVIVKVVPEWSDQKLLLINGDVDWIDNFSAMQVKELKGFPGMNLRFGLVPPSVGGFSFNWKIDPSSPYIGSGKLDGNGIPVDFFTDLNVRKGFAYAFPFSQFIQDAYDGDASQPYTCASADMPYVNKNQERYTFDKVKATDYLKKAWGGKVWELGFKMTWPYAATSEPEKMMAEMIAESLQQINPKFQVATISLAGPVMRADRSKNPSILPVKRTSWHSDFGDPDGSFVSFMSSTSSNARNLYYVTPEIDAKVRAAAKIVDPVKRQAAYYELSKIYFDQCFGVLTYTANMGFAQRDWMKGWYYNPVGFFYTNWAVQSKGY